MFWNIHNSGKCDEYHECEIGLVKKIASQGWDAWVNVPSEVRPGELEERGVGECYKSLGSAKRAVVTAYERLVGFDDEN
jgi:hypothetical protein